MSRWAAVIRTVPKVGMPADSNQDAAAVVWQGDRPRRIAVADGATNAFDSRRWAQILANGWAGSSAGDWTTRHRTSTIRTLSQRWAEGLDLPEDGPWYVRTRAERGAYSTLLGLDISVEARRLHCRALGVGDSNLFVLRGPRLVRTWPSTKRSIFGSFPELIGTATDGATFGWKHTHFVMHHDEVLMLTTDALAAFLLADDTGRKAQGLVAASGQHRDFVQWVAEARAVGMTDDDTTAVVLRRVNR